MTKQANLGKRYTCFQCSRAFYDLNRPEPICPSCGADQRQAPAPNTSRSGTPPQKKGPPPKARTPEAEDELDENDFLEDADEADDDLFDDDDEDEGGEIEDFED